MSYKIKLEVFEGPLDLLIYLVKKDHLNIYDIPIAAVARQYLDYLNLMQLLDLNIAGEFLVMAATLMQIKSKMLLPPEESTGDEGEEEDPRQELVNRLLEYERFKELANNLRQRETEQQQVFRRPKVDLAESASSAKEAYFEASIFDLINAFSQALKDVPREMFLEVIKDEFTVEDKIHQILHLLLQKPHLLLSELFLEAKNKFEIIVTFLSMLELIRMKEITISQRELFSDIKISRNSENILPL